MLSFVLLAKKFKENLTNNQLVCIFIKEMSQLQFVFLKCVDLLLFLCLM